MENRNIFEEWKMEGEAYVGLRSVFWAQRMSFMVRELLESTLIEIPEKMKLLDFCRENYDVEKARED